MLSQNAPFPELDYLFPHRSRRLTNSGSMTPPMDAYRRGEDVWVHLDLPGVAVESIDIDIERNMLTVTAERRWDDVDGDHFYSRERGQGAFRRQVHLGEALDVDSIDAAYDSGVLSVRIPVAEKAKPRKVAVTTSSTSPTQVENAHD